MYILLALRSINILTIVQVPGIRLSDLSKFDDLYIMSKICLKFAVKNLHKRPLRNVTFFVKTEILSCVYTLYIYII